MTAGKRVVKPALLTINRCIALILFIGLSTAVVTIYALERMRSRSAEVEKIISEIHLPSAERATRSLQLLERYATSMLLERVKDPQNEMGFRGLRAAREPQVTLQSIDENLRAFFSLEHLVEDPSVTTLHLRSQELAASFKELTETPEPSRLDLTLNIDRLTTTLEQARRLHLSIAEEMRSDLVLRTERNSLQFLGFLLITLGIGGFAIYRLMGFIQSLSGAEQKAKLELLESNRQLQEKVSQSAELENQLRHAQKMEAIGKLSGGIAHDFNNILTSILGRTELAMATVEKESRLHDYMKAIEKAGEDAAGLVKQLLAFGRKQDLKPRVLDLNGIIYGMEGMLKSLIGAEITLELELHSELGHVLADASQVGQVVMNLASNAKDAIPNGGNLRIETRNVVLDTATTEHELTLMPGQYVQLEVADSGTGMDKKILDKIFDPYFTTKDTGEGIGLGLATVFGIISQSNGHISVHSEPGKGSRFRILLPRVFQPLDAREQPGNASTELGGSETILLVEDDDAVRRLTCEILESNGYRCIAANGPEEALALIFQENVGFDLLITDVVMPKMTGHQLAERMLADRPNTPVLYISGFSEERLGEGKLSLQHSNLVQKPFTRLELLESLRKVLNQVAKS